jgi:hypothetical protein
MLNLKIYLIVKGFIFGTGETWERFEVLDFWL